MHSISFLFIAFCFLLSLFIFPFHISQWPIRLWDNAYPSFLQKRIWFVPKPQQPKDCPNITQHNLKPEQHKHITHSKRVTSTSTWLHINGHQRQRKETLCFFIKKLCCRTQISPHIITTSLYHCHSLSLHSFFFHYLSFWSQTLHLKNLSNPTNTIIATTTTTTSFFHYPWKTHHQQHHQTFLQPLWLSSL